VKDANFTDLKKYNNRFKVERFWSSACYDHAFALKEQPSAKAAAAIPTARPNVDEPAPTDPVFLWSILTPQIIQEADRLLRGTSQQKLVFSSLHRFLSLTFFFTTCLRTHQM
jgi:hypothetical protein